MGQRVFSCVGRQYSLLPWFFSSSVLCCRSLPISLCKLLAHGAFNLQAHHHPVKNALLLRATSHCNATLESNATSALKVMMLILLQDGLDVCKNFVPALKRGRIILNGACWFLVCAVCANTQTARRKRARHGAASAARPGKSASPRNLRSGDSRLDRPGH